MPKRTYRLKRSIVLVGMMGAGKSAVGRELARELGVAFVDCDDEIVKAANMSIAEIFARDGEVFFRDKETQVLTRLLERAPMVLSTGGGAFMSERNRALIAARGTAVWLQADQELLWIRVRHKTSRPLLRTANPKASLQAIYDQRVPVYALAPVVVEAQAAYSISDMTHKVIETLMQAKGILEKV